MAAAPTNAFDLTTGLSNAPQGFIADQYPRATNICVGRTLCSNQSVTASVSIYAVGRNYICQISKAVMLEGVKHNLFALL
jgi:hypothetical protein